MLHWLELSGKQVHTKYLAITHLEKQAGQDGGICSVCNAKATYYLYLTGGVTPPSTFASLLALLISFWTRTLLATARAKFFAPTEAFVRCKLHLG